jgi:cytochrome P450
MANDHANPADDASTLLSVADRDPQGLYERLLATPGVTWDDGVDAWIVPTYEGCTHLLREDIELYGSAAERGAMRKNLRSTPVLTGDAHARVRRWWLGAFSPSRVEAWRATIFRPVVETMIGRFRQRGEAELWEELALPAPIRVISALLGLPWEDDEWLDRIARPFALISGQINLLPHVSSELNVASAAASAEVREILTPIIRQRKGGEGEDLISQLWRDGPSLLEGWNEDDVFAQALDMFMGGTDTTALGIASATYLLLSDDDLMRRIGSDRALIAPFVEEALRLEPPVHFQVRVPHEDVMIENQHVGSAETVIPLLASANRDPSRWECPHDVVLDRRGTHLTFSYGRRRCLGAAIARAEIQEVVAGLFDSLPNLRLAPGRPKPNLEGKMLRAYRPLHVLFDPTEG